MTVEEVIRELQKQDPETPVMRFYAGVWKVVSEVQTREYEVTTKDGSQLIQRVVIE